MGIKVVAALVVVVAGCGGGDDYGPPLDILIDASHADARILADAPPEADAPPTIDAAPTDIAGRVCVVSDLRVWNTGCDDVGAGGLTVTIGAESATTAADGSFTIDIPSGTNLRIRVSGLGIITSLNPYDSTAASLSAVAPTTAHWAEVVVGSGLVLTTGNGNVIVHATVEGAPAGAVHGVAAPPGDPVHYSSVDSASVWNTTGTDANGKVLVPDLPAGPVAVNITRPPATAQTVNLLVESDAITFASVDLNVP